MGDVPTASMAILGAMAPVILLLTIGIVAAVASHAPRLSPIVGYLMLGVALSGVGLNRIIDTSSVQSLAELGVVFLLFDVGLHFSPPHMCEQAGDIFGFGPVQVVFGTLGLGAIAPVFGFQAAPALLIGATLALSSTAVVARLIAERHQQSCPVGLTGTAILIFQDVAVILTLIVATTLGNGGAVLPAIGFAVVKAAGAFVVALGRRDSPSARCSTSWLARATRRCSPRRHLWPRPVMAGDGVNLLLLHRHRARIGGRGRVGVHGMAIGRRCAP
jgi:Kef-type K+ transport system membrane component KefB